jgi:hypothetical protein
VVVVLAGIEPAQVLLVVGQVRNQFWHLVLEPTRSRLVVVVRLVRMVVTRFLQSLPPTAAVKAETPTLETAPMVVLVAVVQAAQERVAQQPPIRDTMVELLVEDLVVAVVVLGRLVKLLAQLWKMAQKAEMVYLVLLLVLQ